MWSYPLKTFCVTTAIEFALASITLVICIQAIGDSDRATNAAQIYVEHLGEGLNFLLTLFIGIAIQKNFAVIFALQKAKASMQNLKMHIVGRLTSTKEDRQQALDDVHEKLYETYNFSINAAIKNPKDKSPSWENELFQKLDNAYVELERVFEDRGIELREAFSDRWVEYNQALVEIHATRHHFLPESYTWMLLLLVIGYYGIMYPIANYTEHGWNTLTDLIMASLFNNIMYSLGVAWTEPFTNYNKRLVDNYRITTDKATSAFAARPNFDFTYFYKDN